ncbi:MAG: prolipoprotein diacylglyceryl transferase, partial [Oscillospiraceae bacterium]|nr:prolipoprotein diacylglyceryl transferase [Oscillospiraceae bacterium]
MFPGFTLFGKYIGSYTLCGMLGIFIGLPIGIIYYKKFTGKDIPMILTFVYSAAGAFLGMHILYGITNVSKWHTLGGATGFWDFIVTFLNIFGGSVYYGGLIGGLIAGFIYVKKANMPFDVATDCAAVSIPLFHGISRIGCFLGG